MPNTVKTLRPNGTYQATAGFTITGAAHSWEALSDDSDSSFETATASIAAMYETFPAAGLTPPPPPGINGYQSDLIISVTVRVRASTTTRRSCKLTDASTGHSTTFSFPSTGGVIANVSGPAITTLFGSAWTVAQMDHLEVELDGSNSTGDVYYELYLDITYNQVPVVTVDAPVGIVEVASPTVSWTVTDPEGDAQALFSLFIFTAEQVAVGGGTPTNIPDPAIAGAAIYNTEQFTSASSWTIPAALPPADYFAYVQVSDRPGFPRSFYARAAFTIALAQPPAPMVLAGTYDAFRGRIPLSVQSFDNLLSENEAGAETSLADFAVTGATAALDNTAGRVWSPPDGPAISANSLKLTATGAGAVSALVVRRIPVLAGRQILVGVHAWADSAALGSVTATFYDGAGTLVSAVSSRQQWVKAGNAPTILATALAVPTGAASMTLTYSTTAPAGGWNTWIDDLFVAPTVADPWALCAHWGGNLVNNTSFETWAGSSGGADWHFVTAGGQTAGVIAEVGAPDGDQVAELIKPDVISAPPYAEFPDLSASIGIPVVAGDVVVVTGYAKRISGPGLTVEAVYDGGAAVASVACPQSGVGYEPFVAAFQIPATRTSLNVRLLPVAVGATGTSGEVHVDLINIYRASTAVAATFAFLGGNSSTPKGAGIGSVSHSPFLMALKSEPFFHWTRGGLSTSAVIGVARSIDGGATLTVVRGAAILDVMGAGTAYDYEMTPGDSTLYAATETAADPDLDIAVVSPTAVPLIPDPSFETLAWDGIDKTDTYSNQFQPVLGAFIGAITEPAGLYPDPALFPGLTLFPH